jgi:hypothetical protein
MAMEVLVEQVVVVLEELEVLTEQMEQRMDLVVVLVDIQTEELVEVVIKV